MTRDNSWMQLGPLSIAYAYAQEKPNSSSVQISLHFMIVVVLCNIAKFVAMVLTYRDTSTRFITTGDAVASFLARPEQRTLSNCITSYQHLRDKIGSSRETPATRWFGQKHPMLQAIGEKEWLPYLAMYVQT